MTPQDQFYRDSLKELAELKRKKLALDCKIHRYRRSGKPLPDELALKWMGVHDHIDQIEEYLEEIDGREEI